MPELPEIEKLVRRVRRDLAGKQVHEVLARDPNTGELRSQPAGRATTIAGARRYGKMFSLDLDNGRSVLAHLRLWGAAGFGDRETCLAAQPTLALRAGDEEYFWICQVSPQFVTMLPTVGIRKLDEVRRLGVDPLSRGFTPKTLGELLAKEGRPLKSLLMDQAVLAGIGNTYTDEILFEAAIAPKQKGRDLAEAQVASLYRAIRQVLGRALEGDYGDAPGDSATLRVHQKEGEPCPRCGEPIQKTRLGQRPTFWCPRCQPLNA
jgi:formamidopyrimidine-DNA glycosylase